MRGEVRLGTDLSGAKFLSVDRQGRKVVLQLPNPSVQEARVDLSRTRLVLLRSEGLWAAVPVDQSPATTALTNAAYADAQRLVEGAGKDASLVLRAKEQVELVTAAFYRAAGWMVEVRWTE